MNNGHHRPHTMDWLSLRTGFQLNRLIFNIDVLHFSFFKWNEPINIHALNIDSLNIPFTPVCNSTQRPKPRHFRWLFFFPIGEIPPRCRRIGAPSVSCFINETLASKFICRLMNETFETGAGKYRPHKWSEISDKWASKKTPTWILGRWKRTSSVAIRVDHR